MPIIPKPAPVGETFGHWTVLGEAPKRRNLRYFLCRCACGRESEVAMGHLLHGRALSCGCMTWPDTVPVGTRFGRLVTTAEKISKNGRHHYPCRCDFGAETLVSKQDLGSGHTRSCGCLSRDNTIRRSTKHKDFGSKLYWVWAALIKRCHTPTDRDFKDYGARGISVCDEWRNHYGTFKTWAEANGYKEGLEIDRRDNDGPYEPANCRFVTHQINCTNRRSRWRNRVLQEEE